MIGELCAIDHTGDTKLLWDSENEAETQAAEEMFNSLKKKGYLAFAVKKNGDKGEAITKFDPSAEKIILTPPLKGG